MRRAFPAAVLRAIETEIGVQELLHHGEVRFVVEASLPLDAVIRGTPARERALQLFQRLGVAATRRGNGVLLYVLLAERAVEIVADRPVAERVPQAAWQRVCDGMRARFAAGDFEAGAIEGVRSVGALLALHYPSSGENPNELPDRPVVL